MRTRPIVGSLHPASMPGLIVDRFLLPAHPAGVTAGIKTDLSNQRGLLHSVGHREPDATPWSLGGEIIAERPKGDNTNSSILIA
jgi:hypothetical protein